MWRTWTAESVVFTPWPPGPPARQTSIRRSSGFNSISTSSASGSTATVALEVHDALLQIGNFILGHRCDLDVVRLGQLPVLVELFARCFQFVPFREQRLHVRVLAHDLARAFPVLEKRGVSDLAFELGEAL